jgi:SAM-dependent methyltransferase
MDLFPVSAADLVGNALHLPFAGGTFDLVVSQETVEHLPDPFQALREMARVLRPGGRLYVQAPFVIGYHPGPEDYWRFTHAGLRRLVEQAGLQCVRVEAGVGPGTGFYRMMVEFPAVIAARLIPALYLPIKAAGAVIFFPLKWLDPLLRGGAQSDRIAGGYFALAVKP